jgi:hypothetical protein
MMAPPKSTGAMIAAMLIPPARIAMISLCRERFPSDRSVAMSAAIGRDEAAIAGRLYREYFATWNMVALYLMKLSAL